MPDYPAAHSMDTHWVGVDADGNLALFDSSEGGAVPKSNIKLWQTAQIDGLDSFLWEMSKNKDNCLLELKTSGDVVVDRLTLEKLQSGINEGILSVDKVIGTHYGPEKGMVFPIKLPPLEEQRLDSWLLLLVSDDIIPELEISKIAYNYVARFAGENTIIYVKHCRVVTIQKLVNDGRVLAGSEIKDYGHELPNLLGFFFYSQDSSAPVPYDRVGKPIIPLLLEDLPEHLQDLVTWNWFDRLQFANSDTIQPIEYMRCDTWSGNRWWLDTQGQEHEEHPQYGV